MTIKYAGPMLDYSGYGETSRHHIAALTAAGVTVIGELLSYSSENSDYGTLGPVVHEAINRKGDYDIKLLHSTPDEFPRLIEDGKYHIGFCYWETDKIPEAFIEGLNAVDEIWTASQANFEAIRKGGVTKPIKIIPQPLEVKRDWPDRYVINDFDGFLFYSIFEWTDRKNPRALIEAYLKEFSHNENVGLLIKTYFRNFSYSNKKMIRNKVQLIKDSIKVKDQPPIYLYLDLMDRQQIMRIHQTGDCFVSAHRGEGWGLPQVEASLAGKPMISTNYGGSHEYFTDSTAKLLPFEMTPLAGMQHSQRFYSETQNWADVKVKDVRKSLRWVYDNQKEAKEMGKLAQSFVTERFNFKRVGNEMLDELNKVEI